MKHLALILGGLLVAAPAARAAGTPAAQFRGFAAVERLINERMMISASKFKLAVYLGGDAGSSSTPLTDLLGHYPNGGAPGHNDFRNGTPNTTNTLLWHLLLNAFSQDLAKLCSPTPPEGNTKVLADNLRPAVRQQIDLLCTWPAPAAQDPKVLQAYWDLLIANEAPPTEFAAWKDFVLKEYATAPAADALPAITTAILMNPRLLLAP